MADYDPEKGHLHTRFNVEQVSLFSVAYKRGCVDRGVDVDINVLTEFLSWAEEVLSGKNTLSLLITEAKNPRGICLDMVNGRPLLWNTYSGPAAGPDTEDPDMDSLTDDDGSEAVKFAEDLLDGVQ